MTETKPFSREEHRKYNIDILKTLLPMSKIETNEVKAIIEENPIDPELLYVGEEGYRLCIDFKPDEHITEKDIFIVDKVTQLTWDIKTKLFLLNLITDSVPESGYYH